MRNISPSRRGAGTTELLQVPNPIILPHCPVCSEQILSFQRAWEMLFIVQNPVTSPVERRQILEEIKPWINLLHVDLTCQCPNRALTAPSFSGLVLSFVLEVLGVIWALLLCTELTAHDLYLCFILNCSPLWSSHSKYFFKCSNINLIWEDKEEAWTFLWMYEEVGGCCNTQGYFWCFGLRNKSLPSALRIHEMCLYSVQNPHQNIWWEFRKLGMCHVQQWESQSGLNAE